MLEYQGRPVAHRGRAGDSESCCIFFLALFRGDLEHLRMRAQLVRVACKALAGGKIEARAHSQYLPPRDPRRSPSYGNT